jgi:hypothetical protein
MGFSSFLKHWLYYLTALLFPVSTLVAEAETATATEKNKLPFFPS